MYLSGELYVRNSHTQTHLYKGFDLESIGNALFL